MLLLLLIPCWNVLTAQAREQALSDREVETLRETAYIPTDRLAAFIVFVDDRARAIDTLQAGRRKAGREEDTHTLMEQMTSILEDLGDNLDDYTRRHKDVRKALPKLLAATERWETAVKAPPDDPAYKVSRVLALEIIADVRESTKKMIEEQKAYFLAHPPGKDDANRPEESPRKRPF